MIHRSFMPDVLSYNSALHGCARAGQWQQALLLFDQILAHGLVPSAWGPPKEIQVGDVFVEDVFWREFISNPQEFA